MNTKALVLVCALALPSTVAHAQRTDTYPSRTATIVVASPPGGNVDILARIVGDGLRERLKQPFIVENRGAAAVGAVGAASVFRSEPDGYTLFASPNSPLVFNPLTNKNLGYDAEAFVPIIPLGMVPLVMAVRGNFPGSTFKDFVDYAKANPGKLNYGSQGVGGGNHLSTLLLQQITGTEMVHIPYTGEAPARQALLTGDIDLFMAPMSGMLPLYRDGKLKIFAVGSTKRVPELPDVPTFQELGFHSDVVLTVWFALVAPPKTPASVVDKLNATINEIYREPAVRERYKTLAMDPVGGTPQALVQFLAEERARWKRVVEEAKLGGQ
jgi:tripartite-type tricarboxylate transporter receptor subunit TctC